MKTIEFSVRISLGSDEMPELKVSLVRDAIRLCRNLILSLFAPSDADATASTHNTQNNDNQAAR